MFQRRKSVGFWEAERIREKLPPVCWHRLKEGNFRGVQYSNPITPIMKNTQTDLEMDALCRRLYEYRLKRAAAPHRDDKIGLLNAP